MRYCSQKKKNTIWLEKTVGRAYRMWTCTDLVAAVLVEDNQEDGHDDDDADHDDGVEDGIKEAAAD